VAQSRGEEDMYIIAVVVNPQAPGRYWSVSHLVPGHTEIDNFHYFHFVYYSSLHQSARQRGCYYVVGGCQEDTGSKVTYKYTVDSGFFLLLYS